MAPTATATATATKGPKVSSDLLEQNMDKAVTIRNRPVKRPTWLQQLSMSDAEYQCVKDECEVAQDAAREQYAACIHILREAGRVAPEVNIERDLSDYGYSQHTFHGKALADILTGKANAAVKNWPVAKA